MHHSQPGPSASASTGSLKRQLSPEMGGAQGSTLPGVTKQASRRPTKRTRPTKDVQQPTHTPYNTVRSAPGSPAKLPKARAAGTASDGTSATGEQNRPGILQPVLVPQPTMTLRVPTFSGNFDLYGMYLPSLTKACLPPGATTPNYSAVYDRILASQARHDYTARCFLAPLDASSSPPHGRFESASVLNPMIGRPFDITLDFFIYKKSLTFTPTERLSFPAPESDSSGPGLVGRTRLSPACGIKSANGVFKIRRIWATEQDASVKELFEGFFSFGVCYDTLYRKAGHGNGAKYTFAFWGVRAMKDNAGKEIGLGPRKNTW